MCDESTEKDNQALLKGQPKLDRRSFTGLLTASAFMSFFPSTSSANTLELTEQEVAVPMAEGVSDSYFVAPTKGKYPGVLMWPDIKGLRPAFKAMGKRLAMEGYAVLVVNPFYRDAKHPVVDSPDAFSDPDTRKYLFSMARKLNQGAAMSDARDYIAFIDAQAAVDTTLKLGTAGYCMGGPLIMRTAAAVPKRVGAAASFHGGGLVTEADDSPHLLIPESPAQILHAVAENDDKKDPNAKVVLAKAYKNAGISAEIEVYEGAMHGWCPPDSPVYNEAQAEKAWSRLLALYKSALV